MSTVKYKVSEDCFREFSVLLRENPYPSTLDAFEHAWQYCQAQRQQDLKNHLEELRDVRRSLRQERLGEQLISAREEITRLTQENDKLRQHEADRDSLLTEIDILTCMLAESSRYRVTYKERVIEISEERQS